MLLFSYFLSSKLWQEVETALLLPTAKISKWADRLPDFFFQYRNCLWVILTAVYKLWFAGKRAEWMYKNQTQKCNKAISAEPKKTNCRCWRSACVYVCVCQGQWFCISTTCPHRDGKNAVLIINSNVFGISVLEAEFWEQFSMTYSVFINTAI